jgi:regulator of protease activity HflC (stomatin/prohibitin superfamily)
MTRLIFTIVCWGLALILVLLTTTFIGGSYRVWIGFAIWIVLVTGTLRFFMVSVPEVAGLVTINLLSGRLYPYGPGLHFRYPWEQIKEGNYINFRLVKKEIDETYPAKDGPELKVKWFFQYRPQLNLLGRYIAVSEEVIDSGLTDVGSSFLSQEIGARRTSAESCKRDQNEIEQALRRYFEEESIIELFQEGVNLGIPCEPPEGEAPTLEWLYGINLVRVGIHDMDYEEKYQKARSSKAISKKLTEIANKLKRGNISEKDALNAAMIINKDIMKHVQEVEGKGGEALAALLMAMARGGK